MPWEVVFFGVSFATQIAGLGIDSGSCYIIFGFHHQGVELFSAGVFFEHLNRRDDVDNPSDALSFFLQNLPQFFQGCSVFGGKCWIFL